MRSLAILLFSLLVSLPAMADITTPVSVEELDGSPSVYPYKLKFSNGTITDNGDGTATVTISSGSISDTAYSVSGWNGQTSAAPSQNAVSDEMEVLRGQNQWQTVSNVLSMKVTSDTVTVGHSETLAKFGVSNDADRVGILARGHTTQTNSLLKLEQSDGTDVFTVANDGTVSSGGSNPFFTLPNGTNPTVDATGEIALDTTANQLVYALNSSVVVSKHSQDQVCYKTENLVDTDDNTLMWIAPVASSVVGVGCRMSGDVATLATITLTDGAGNAMTHTQPTCVSGDTALTFQSVTANNTLTQGEGLTFSVTNTPASTTNEYLICAKTVETRQ